MPEACAACGSEDVRRHCLGSKTCSWIRCVSCRAVTGIVYGEPRAITPRM